MYETGAELMLYWANTFKVQSKTSRVKANNTENFESCKQPRRNQKQKSMFLQQFSFSKVTPQLALLNLDTSPWNSMKVDLQYLSTSRENSVLFIPHSNTNMSCIICKPLFLCTQQIYMLLVFSISATGSIWIHNASHDQVVFENFYKSKNGVWTLWPLLSIHLNKDGLTIKVSHCLKIASSLNWKKPEDTHFQKWKYNWHCFVPLLAISSERPMDNNHEKRNITIEGKVS